MVKRFSPKCSLLKWSLRELFLSAPLEFSLLSLLVVLQGVAPATMLWVTKVAVNGMATPGSQSLVLFSLIILLWFAILVVETALSPFISLLRIQLNEKILTRVNKAIMEKASSIQGLAPFENPEIYDHIQFLKNEAASRPMNLVYILTGFVRDFFALCSIFLLLFFFSWWIPVVILLSAIPHAIANYKFEKASWDQLLFNAPESRKLAWLSSQLVDASRAQEIRFFNAGAFFIESYTRLARSYHGSLKKGRLGKSRDCFFLSMASVLGNVSIFVVTLVKGRSGLLTLGEVVVVLQALVMTQLQLNGCIANLGMSAPVLSFFEKLESFLRKKWCELTYSKTCSLPCSSFPRDEIRFENVSFSYPDGRQALDRVSFTIQKGTKVGIVGHNGAGKSSLIKLLARFYDPTAGNIFVDGINLRDLDPKSWRRCLSGTFQEIGRYEVSVKENLLIGMSNAKEQDLHRASDRGGFSPVLKKLSDGLDSVLGKEFGGTSLSGGEWQKLAMSRAFLRDAGLLILDEPTASLDPKSELEIFQQFADLADEKTAFLVTHRLGSVKMADKILVLDKGRIVEEGTHRDLMQKKGLYFELFQIQSSKYIDVV